MKKHASLHPGEILLHEFMKPLGITAYRLAKETGVAQTRISQIIKGSRSITADTALRLSHFFGNSELFWMNLQNDYDLHEARRKHDREYECIEPLQRALIELPVREVEAQFSGARMVADAITEHLLK